MVMIRKESPEDYTAVRRVNELAFGQPDEAVIVDKLRGVVQPLISLVAVLEGKVVGHILFSPVSIEAEGSAFSAFGLGPMAVLPGFQRQGTGSQLVRRGLEECGRLGKNVVVVIGHPEFYPRFGFSSAKAKGLQYEYEVPDEAFMVAELTPGALRGRAGVVKFRPEFDSC
jgi:putative acetyltransferase